MFHGFGDLVGAFSSGLMCVGHLVPFRFLVLGRC